MKNHEQLFTYIGFAAVGLLLFGLAGWYIFIRGQTTTVEDAASARGFSIGIPSFVGSRGSTASNSTLTGSFRSFLGFESEGERIAEGDTGDTSPESNPDRRAPRVWHAHETPIAGLSFIASTTKLLFVERATGHTFEADVVTGDVRRITNTLLPKVYGVAIGDESIVHSVLDSELRTLYSRIGTTTDDGYRELETRNLGVAASSIAALPELSEALVLVEDARGTRIFRMSPQSTTSTEVLSVPAGNLALIWAATSRIFLVEKPASGLAGSLFRAGATLVPVIKNVMGLTALPHPTLDAYLYGSDDGQTLRFYVKAPNANSVELPIQTVADKCVWTKGDSLRAYCAVPKENPGANFLNRWFKGEVHTDDSWFTINPGAGTADRFFNHNSEAGVDVENVRIDDSGKYLAFMNARDKSLWVLRIDE